MMAPAHSIFFKPVNCCRVVITTGGIYSEFPIYENGEHLFAKISPQRYIKLLAGGTTSSKARWMKVYFTDEAEEKRKWIRA